MKKSRLTLVVGAGASKELGLPLGSDLRSEIASLLKFYFDFDRQTNGDKKIFSALKIAAREAEVWNLNEYIEAASRISLAMPQAISIDNFIDSHQGNEEIELCGKLAIVRSILRAEGRSAIFVDSNTGKRKVDFSRVENYWLTSFTKVLTENARIDDLSERLASVNFVIFNYDRCVEHYLFSALKNYYGLSEAKVASLLNSVSFYHPYGSIGPLPWQQDSSGASRVAYGDDVSSEALLNSARNIKTFTEGTDPESSDICEVRNVIRESENVLFLGFAFHRLNMGLLSSTTVNFDETSAKRTFGTAFGISASDCSEIASELRRMRGSPRVEIRNSLTCHSIFSEYTRGISLS